MGASEAPVVVKLIGENKLEGTIETLEAWAKHYPEHRAEKVSEHVCRLISAFSSVASSRNT
jgi:hypothetical protein